MALNDLLADDEILETHSIYERRFCRYISDAGRGRIFLLATAIRLLFSQEILYLLNIHIPTIRSANKDFGQ